MALAQMIGRAAGIVGCAALPLTTALPAAHADVFFQAETSAAAVHVTITQEPASSIITASLLDDAVSYAASSYDSGGSSEALAASAFPGRLVVQGPQLLCSQLFSCPATPPDYPFLADASYPRRTHDTATVSGQPTGSGPFVVTPLTADAVAGATGNHAGTRAGGVSLLTGTPGAVVVGASNATSEVVEKAGRLEVTVTSDVQDITIAGLVHIGNVRAADTVTLDAGHRPVAKPTITVSGVTVAGHAASVDDKGLHVDGAGGPGLARQVAQRGVSIRTVGAQHDLTANGARSDATGLAVDVSLPISGVPYIPNPLPPLPPPFDQIPQLPGVDANGSYVGHITFGAVGAAAGLGIEPAFDLGATRPASGTAGAGAPNGSAGSPLAGNSLVSTLGSTAARPQAAPQVAGSTPGPFRVIADLLSKADIESLYLVIALGSLGLFVGWRTAVAVRGRTR